MVIRLTYLVFWRLVITFLKPLSAMVQLRDVLAVGIDIVRLFISNELRLKTNFPVCVTFIKPMPCVMMALSWGM